LENRQADHQASMVEVEGMLNNQPISILIDPGASLSYVSPKLVEICKLQKEKFEKAWLVQLAIGTKRKVTNLVKGCEISMNGFKTQEDLNILHLGSYDVLISMDWLEKYKVILNCYDKTFTYVYENGNIINIKRIPITISIRKISALHIKRCVRKGCKVFVVHVIDNEKEESKKDI
jgi:hypothetical protein